MKSAVLAVALLVGCATTSGAWYRDGSTEREFKMEYAQCRSQHTQTVATNPNAGLAQSVQFMSVFMDCMAGKGWEWR